MRIRNQGTAEPATTRKTPPTRKSAAKISSGCTDAAAESTALKTAGTKQASAAKAKQMEKNEISTVIIDGSDSNLERSAVEEVKSSPEATRLTPESKATPGTKLVSKRTPGRPKRAVSAKGKAVSVVNSEGTANEKVLESPNKVEMEHQKVKEREKIEETGKSKLEEEVPCDGNIEEYVAKEDSLLVSGTDRKIVDLNVKEGRKDKLSGEDGQMEQDRYGSFDDEFEYGDRVDFGDHDDEVLADDDVDDPIEETEALEEECKELTAIAKEHKIKKECEIFVGGLDRDAVEEDLRQVFEKIGEVVEVRLHKNPITNKNKGYAFVKFSNKEHAKHALLEMKNPVICGKRCGTAPSEDNDTLFLGNICSTWTKEAIKQNLKEYGIEGVENITLVPDVQHEGLSRGFAFLEFSCHADAMLAYKRLQKPDVVFGHPERTAKVAFAEPLREPDPEIMATVKTVFLDSLPPHWDEDRVREKLKGYGEIVRIVLARNMSTAKRKDFGFVDFSTHKAATACVDGVNTTQLGDGNSKTKVRARLSNPMPKTQAIKGGMSGGFRIGSGGNGTFSRFGRTFGQVGHCFNSKGFQHGRYYHQNERGRTSTNEHDFDNRYSEFHRQQVMGKGGRRGSYEDGYRTSSRAASFASPSRYNLSRSWYDGPERAWREHAPLRRQPFSPQRAFDQPYGGQQYDDPYYYDESAHSMKRPFYMTDHDPEYMEPPRFRPRMDHPYPEVTFHETRHRGVYFILLMFLLFAAPVNLFLPYHSFMWLCALDPHHAAGSGLYSHDYFGSDYDAYPPYYRDHSYGGSY
ncbi:nucleolin-like isoform X1 [Gossypium australe]|uniref:Nucleolin-like isoform X1 n=1 Tax=Gossypium australe TaxID=47621 RepID=A0A5B6VZS7_9ROSI|nr:nucleolin-like isoform X1 [Gossypium australe]